jgi:hypothetical protein
MAVYLVGIFQISVILVALFIVGSSIVRLSDAFYSAMHEQKLISSFGAKLELNLRQKTNHVINLEDEFGRLQAFLDSRLRIIEERKIALLTALSVSGQPLFLAVDRQFPTTKRFIVDVSAKENFLLRVPMWYAKSWNGARKYVVWASNESAALAMVTNRFPSANFIVNQPSNDSSAISEKVQL